jgi:hypothetical protein
MFKLFAREKDSPVPKKFDGVIEAVRYGPDGRLQLARIYERRGPTWSDVLLISREELVRRLKAGQKFVTGARKPYLASTFDVKSAVRLAGVDGGEILLSGVEPSVGDRLDAPLF